MSSIDDVIARSRQPGQFKEVRRFTVARSEAMQKMRKFALADPNFYILELVQAAVANGAVYVDISASQRDVTLSYIGGGFKREELEDLFEFLFAAKSDVDVADVRQLALGINAIIGANPKEIVIESGAGTLETTHRVEILDQGKHVQMGMPDKPLDGTFISIKGIDRYKLNSAGAQKEESVLMERCIMAPIPIIYNNDPIFGTASIRHPTLFGFTKTLKVDEGDLYGTIGIPNSNQSAHFRLVTHGVWVQSMPYDHNGQRMGGALSFERLRKSADHSSIVQDEALGEMWFRLQPYFEQLITGVRKESKLAAYDLKGNELDLKDIRNVLRDHKSVVVSSPEITDEQGLHAQRMAEAIGAPLILVGSQDLATFRQLFPSYHLVFPQFTADELKLFSKAEWQAPAQPWLAAPETLPPITAKHPSLAGFVEFVEAMPQDFEIRLEAFFPNQKSRTESGIGVEIVVANRRIYSGLVHSNLAGAHVVIHVPIPVSSSLSATQLFGKRATQTDPEDFVNQVILGVEQSLERVLLKTVNTIEDFESDQARTLLQSVMQGRIITEVDEKGILGFRVVSNVLRHDLVEKPLFRTLKGELRSLNDLAKDLNRFGAIYGVNTAIEPDLEGIDLSHVLELHEFEEIALIQMIGYTAYVRVDARDVLVEHKGAQVRDWAFGIREFSDSTLLIESYFPPEDHDMMARKICENWYENHQDPEMRRHAHRHLVHYLTELMKSGGGAPQWLLELRLFPTNQGLVSMKTIMEEAPVVMMDGWPSDLAALDTDPVNAPREAKIGELKPKEPLTLMLHPVAARALHELELVRPLNVTTKEVDFLAAELSPDLALVHRIQNAALDATLGIQLEGQGDVQVMLMKEREVHHLPQLARNAGVSGVVKVDDLSIVGSVRELEGWLFDQVGIFYHQLVRQVLSGVATGERRNLILKALMQYAARHFMLMEETSGFVVRCTDVVANQVISLPIVETEGGLTTVRQVLQSYLKATATRDYSNWVAPWLESTNVDTKKFLKIACTQSAIIRPPSRAAKSTLDYTQPLEDWLNQGIKALSPSQTKIFCRLKDNVQPLVQLELIALQSVSAEVNVNHPLVQRALHSSDARNLLLVAIYGTVNSYFQEVTDQHELEFQAALAELLSKQ